MGSLTKREKILVIGAGALALICIYVFLMLLPSLRIMQDTDLEKGDIVFQQQEAEMAIANLPQTKMRYTDAKEELAEAQAKLFYAPSNTAIDEWVTNFCVSHGLLPKSLTIDKERTPLVAPVQENAESTGSTDGAEVTDEADGEISSQEGTQVQTSAVSTTTVSVSVEGTFSEVVSLSNDVSKLPFVRIRSLKFTTGNQSVSIVFEMFLREDVRLT